MRNILLTNIKIRFRTIWVLLFGLIVPISLFVVQQYFYKHENVATKLNTLSGTIFYGVLAIALTSFSNEVVQKITILKKRRIKYFDVSINKMIFTDIIISVVTSSILIFILIGIAKLFYNYSFINSISIMYYILHMVILALLFTSCGYLIANITKDVKLCMQVSLLLFFIILYLAGFIIPIDKLNNILKNSLPFYYVHKDFNYILLGKWTIDFYFLGVTAIWLIIIAIINKFIIK